MSHKPFVSELSSIVRMDEPLTRVPPPRWQRKNLDSSKNNGNASMNTSKNNSLPIKNPDYETKETPSETPSKTPSKKDTAKTPNKGNKTPGGGDRFIPNRTTTNRDLSHFKLNQQQNNENDMCSPNKLEKQRAMSESLHGCDLNKTRILSFQVKAPAPPDGHQNPLKVVYSQSKATRSAKSSRFIPQSPDRILDAPDIIDDYYLNLVDWSSSNLLAVALSRSVYLWNAGTGTIDHLLELQNSNGVASVSWVEGMMLGVGTFEGEVQIWDSSQKKCLRRMNGHSARVGSLCWNSYVLSSGCRAGIIAHHDVRQSNHLISSVQGHSLEVCGLKWSPDGKFLASGGNDNTLHIWPSSPGEMHAQRTPLHTFNAHQAAVKALAWCPWQNSIIASGGGTSDRHIRIWNCQTGSSVSCVDTESQVCGILWSDYYKELISGHGYAKNQLTIWKYPSLTKVQELTGHTSRVLHLALSPDGSTVLSAGADETLRLWRCFEHKPKKTPVEKTSEMFKTFHIR